MKKIIALIVLLTTSIFAVSPIDVKHFNFVNQTGLIPVTTIYTVPTTGYYRINIVEDSAASTGGCNGIATLSVSWTNDRGSASNSVIIQCNIVPTHIEAVFPARLIASSAVTAEVNGTVPSGLTYDIYITIEQLP